MPARKCPACKALVENNISPSGECMSCGHDLVSTAAAPMWQLPGGDLRGVAARQRTLLWFVLAIVVIYFSALMLAASSAVPQGLVVGNMVLVLILDLAALITIIRLQSALGIHIAWRILTVVLMFAPCVNLIVLLSVNSRATAALSRAGLKVGVLGVSAAQVERVLSSNRCTGCGYIVAGNVSGRCPECGAQLGAA